MCADVTQRPFGVEIEVVRFPYGYFLPIDGGILPPYRLPKKIKEDFKKEGLELGREDITWRFVEERSLRGPQGIEMLSPPLIGKDGLLKLKKALKILKANGAKVNKTCGLHIHHDASDFGCQELRNLLELMLVWEPLIYRAIPDNERRVKRTCQPISRELVELARELSEKECEDTKALQELWYAQSERLSKNARYNETRYHGLNFHSFWFRGTVEFRYMRGTLIWDIVKAWILFTQALMEEAKAGLSQNPKRDLYGLFAKWRESLILLEC